MDNGAQRFSIAQLKAWEKMRYGMFLHFGMSTFTGEELPSGKEPSELYFPTDLDVAQWVRVAKNAGMNYAVLTTKHVSGHCLWNSAYTDYSVATSKNTTDVVGAFVSECRKQGILPGFYYCSWDNHTRFGSVTPSTFNAGTNAFTSAQYNEYQSNQIRELLTNYGEIAEVWIDIPLILGRSYRTQLYQEIASLQPNAVIIMNHGISDGSDFHVRDAWPTDVITIERTLPNSDLNFRKKVHTIEGNDYYIPFEVCDTIGKEWFYREDDVLRSDEELLGMYLVTTARGANFLLDVGPDLKGQIPKRYEEALLRLKANIDKINVCL